MSGDRSLWLAVISQAIIDATSNIVSGEAPASYGRVRVQTQRWLTVPNADFTRVCALAGVEPDQVRRLARKQIAAFEQRRQNPDAPQRRRRLHSFETDHANA